MKENVESELFIQILYDNIAYNENLIADWGFSCMINIGGKNILFDTGAKGDILLNNMNKLSIDPKSIDYVFISHDHWDHTGGLEEFLKINNNVKVFLLKSFSDKTKQIVKDNSAENIEVENEQKIFENIFTTGDMIGEKHEQSLIIETNKGNIIIAGCAHPNIVNIIRKAKKLSDNDVLLVAGGFHYLHDNIEQINNNISKLKSFKIKYVAPSHCTGDLASKQIKQSFGDKFIVSGVGKILTEI